LIVEEYIHSQNRQEAMATIPEDRLFSAASPNPSLSLQSTNAPPHPVYSRASSRNSFGPRMRSFEGRVSFEPVVESLPGSFDVDGENVQRTWKQSLPGPSSPQGSTYSSILSGSSNHHQQVTGTSPPLSPNNSHSHIRDATQRLLRAADDSHDSPSSARNSASEDQLEDMISSNQRIRARSQPLDLELLSHNSSVPEHINIVAPKGASETEAVKNAQVEGSLVRALHASGTVSDSEPISRPHLHDHKPSAPRAIGRRIVRVSLPDPDRLVVETEQQRQQDVDEDQVRLEYEVKAR
jgi:hypothetical protein